MTMLTRNKILVSFLSLTASTAYSSAFFFAPRFNEVFDSFGSDLPLLTSIFMTVSPAFIVLGIFSLMGFLVWVPHLENSPFLKIIEKASYVNVIISLATFVLFFIAVYLPIFFI